MESITGAVEQLHKLSERIGVIDMNAIELCLSYLIETCSELEDRTRRLEKDATNLFEKLSDMQHVA